MAFNLQGCKILSDADDTYHIALPSGRKMTLDKTGLSEKAHAVIKSLKGPQHFDDGGSVAPASDSVQDSPEQIAVDATATPPLQGEQMGPPIPQTDGAIPVQAPSDDIAGQKAMTTNSALNEEKDVMGKIGDIQAGEGAAESGAIQQGLNKANGLKSQNDLLNEYNQKGDALMQSYANKSIDPDRYYKNMSTGSKVAAGIGMLLSGFGAGASHQQNLAAQTIQGAVDRDISAQQNDQSKAMNLYKMNQEQYGNASAALAATQNQIYTGIKYKLMQAEANAKGPLAKQQAQLGMAQIDQKIGENNFKLSLLDPRNGEVSPEQKVPYLVPPERQKDVFDEIKNASNIHKNAPKMLESFDNAANKLHAADFVPGIESVDQKILHQLMLPNFKSIDGTVRQAAMDESFHNLTPQFGDTKKQLQTKRQGLLDWMESEQSALTAKGFGIDLNNYKNTQMIHAAPQIQTMGGIQYQKVPGGWKKVQ